MKVNFDQLFTQEPVRLLDPQLIRSTILTPSLNKSYQLNDTVQTQQQTNFLHQEQVSEAEEQESIRHILEFKIALALEEESRRQDYMSKIKSRPPVDTNEITQRLYNHNPCDHKCCYDYKLEKQIKQQAEELWIRQHSMKYKVGHPTKVEQQSALSERLHNHANYKKIKLLELKLKQQRDDKQKFVRRRFSNNKSYLQNYVPFYDRLESQVRKSQQKQKIYQSDPFCGQDQKQPYFKPKKYTHKYQDVQSRYWREPSQYNDRLSFFDDFSYSSVNTSSLSILSLDRSIQLVNSVEEYFLEKMKCIFVEKEKQFIEMNAQMIELLSEVEFRILMPFIMELEEGNTSSKQFEDKLRDFIQKLQFRDKQQLRTHQTKARKATMKRDKISNKTNRLQTTKSSLSTKCKPQKASKYLNKFENYV